MEKNLATNDKDKKKKRGALVICLILLLSILLGAGLWVYNQNKKTESVNNNAESGIVSWDKIDEDSFENYLKKIQDDADKSKFSVEINSSPRIDPEKLTANLLIQNRPTNGFNMSVDIIDNETKEKVYSTGILKPNQHISTAKLNKSYSDGKHPAKAVFKALDMTTGNVVQTVNVDITIYAGKI